MNNSSGMVGFNPDRVHDCINRVKQKLQDLDGNSFFNIAKTGEDLSHAWACPEAVNAINEFKSEGIELLRSVEASLLSIVSNIVDAAKYWGQTTNTTIIFSYDFYSWFRPITNYFNYEPKEEIGGIRGVDAGQARLYIEYLRKYADRGFKSLDAIVNIVNESGFIGANQQQSLNQGVNNIKLYINKRLEEWTNKYIRLINDTVDKYEDTAGSIERAFWESTEGSSEI